MSGIDTRVVAEPIDPAQELHTFLDRAAGAGGVASFTGVTRTTDADGGIIDALVLDAHPTLTVPSLASIATAAQARFALSAATVVHRSGVVAPGAPIVFAATAAPHRREAIDALDYLMDRVKTEAVFWKAELRGTTRRWIAPRDADRADRARWE